MPLPVASRLLVFTSITDARLLVFKVTTDLEESYGSRANENATELSFYRGLAVLLGKCFSDCCKPLVNFRSSETVDFDNSCPCSLLSWRNGFQRFLLHYPRSTSSHPFNLHSILRR